MKPDIPVVLQQSFGKLLMDVAPHITAEYAVGSTSVIGLMMFMSATEFERGAEVRASENRTMRAIFDEAEGLVEEAGLQAKLADAASGQDASLLLSDLDASNDRLKGLLIELHSVIEEMDSPQARALNARIWAFLSDAAEARKLPYPSLG